MEKKEKYILVNIKWEDAVANPNWFNYSEMQGWGNNCRCVIDEIGYLIFKNKDYTILASAVADETPLTEEKLGQLHLIPNKMIISQIRVVKGKVQWRAKRDKEATRLARLKK